MRGSGESLRGEQLRYERKALIQGLSRASVEHHVKLHPAAFRRTFPPRMVNNVYLDTIDFQHYQTNVDGVQHRVKVRVRWYGDLLGRIEDPVLELKIRDGGVGRKEIYPVVPFDLGRGFCGKHVIDRILRPSLPKALREKIARLECKLLNRYARSYYRSRCRHFRVTVDSDQEFYRLRQTRNGLLEHNRDRESVILEIKYEREHDGEADRIAGPFPFPFTRMSKYVYGVERLYGGTDDSLQSPLCAP